MLRLAEFFMIIVAILAALLGLILAVSGWVTGLTNDIVLGVLLIVVPAAVLLVVRHLAIRQGRSGFDSALEGFVADEYAWYHGSGLAISSVRRQVLVAGPSSHKIYALDDFAGARSSFTTDVWYGGSGPLAIFMIMIALVRIIIGFFTDGLFLQFRDDSSWQITGLKKRDAALWTERLAAASGPGERAAGESIVTSR